MNKLKLFREIYKKLKRIIEKIINKKKDPLPSLVLQPVRQKKFEGY